MKKVCKKHCTCTFQVPFFIRTRTKNTLIVVFLHVYRLPNFVMSFN